MTRTEVAWAVPGEERLPRAEVERAVHAALEHGRRPGLSLAITFVDDAFLTELHERHLGDPTRTDVITFDLGEEGEGPAGELYVSVERAAEVARARRVSLERELTLYLVHGVLHLCGFDDHGQAERAAMRAAEAQVMDALGFPPDTREHHLGAEV